MSNHAASLIDLLYRLRGVGTTTALLEGLRAVGGGTMMDLPANYPMYCLDIKQECDRLGNPELPPQSSTEHNALEDSRWNKKVWEFLQGHLPSPTINPEKERKHFEEWYILNHLDWGTDPLGSRNSYIMWKAWQARASKS